MDPREENILDRVIAYLKANDVHEDRLEDELVSSLEEFREQLVMVLSESSYALGRSAEFAGLIGDGDEEINAPWNEGGYGYHAHIQLLELLDELRIRNRS